MRIAITGGIGSGKTYIANYIKSKGYKVVDADQVARQLMQKGNINHSLIVDYFGEEILDQSGEIDRKALRKIVFKDPDKRKMLNKLTHPAIMKQILEETSGEAIYFIEIPLLFEENLEKDFDQSWVADCCLEEQIDRVIKRSKLQKKEVMDIIESQLSREARNDRADVVIDTQDEELYNKIDSLIKGLEKQENNEKRN